MIANERQDEIQQGTGRQVPDNYRGAGHKRQRATPAGAQGAARGGTEVFPSRVVTHWRGDGMQYDVHIDTHQNNPHVYDHDCAP